MDIRNIKKLIDLFKDSDITELEIHEGEESVRISRQSSQTVVSSAAAPVMPAPAAIVAAEPSPTAADSSAIVPIGHTLKSPMVGTFYRSTSPEARPLVEVGQRVEIGQPICIIEAMKMFNQIESDHSGIIADILVDNGQPVEYDQPLLVIQ
jgi:acetyl-CoA carboxylase biotin carboxyl carrier protein